MTATIQNLQTLKLYTLAVADESALQFPLPDHLYGFAAQQSCEKLLKALLNAHGQTYPFTHAFRELTKMLKENCAETVPSLPFSLQRLQPYAVALRYDSSPGLSDADRIDVRESVTILRSHILQRILTVEQAPKP